MTENLGFEHVTSEDVEPSTSRRGGTINEAIQTEIIIDEDYNVGGSYICCSWSRMCDVLGNRQGNFILELRPLRAHLIRAQQSLRRFQLELERGIKTKESAHSLVILIHKSVSEINKLTTHTELNIPPDESEVLRQVSYDLAVLGRVVEEVYYTTSSRHTTKRDIGTETPQAPATISREVLSLREDIREEEHNRAAVDEHSLKERINRNSETLEKLIKFIDKKTERRWWLRDVINFLQLFIKLALFVSAAISVAYHDYQIAPIITLTITVIQGIVEMLDQYFLKHTKPEEIKLSIMTTLTALDKKS